MNIKIYTSLIVLLIFTTVILSGCSEDPVGSTSGVTAIRTNGSFSAVNKTTLEGTMFVTDQNNNPILNINSSNVSATLKWAAKDSSVTTGTITVTPNNSSGKNVAGAITLDLSGSMGSQQIQCMNTAVNVYIDSMKTNDLSEIIKFASTVEVIQNFTNNKTALHTAVNSNWPGTGGSTALYESILVGTADAITQPSNLTRTVIAFTDGGENASSISRDSMISYALTNGIPVYTVGLLSDSISTNANDLKNIADTTGAFFFYKEPNNCSNLSEIYSKISNQLRGSYSVIINWNGTLPTSGTVVTAIIKTTYNGLTHSFTKSYVIP